MKRIFLPVLILLLPLFTPIQAQVSIGANKAPEPYSILEIISSTSVLGGLRIPQVQNNLERQAIEDQFAAADQLAKGLLIFNHESNGLEYWNGNDWITLILDGGVQAQNGLTSNGSTLRLGGTLTEPTTITTTPTNNFSVSGADMLINNLRVGQGSGTNTSLNTAIGINSLNFNTTGTSNTALGASTLENLTTGSNNTAVGALAMQRWATTAAGNTAIGTNALQGGATITGNTGANNTAVGFNALAANTSAAGATAVGASALAANTTGSNNTAVGFSALQNVTTGGNNTAFGFQALQRRAIGSTGNTAVGVNALQGGSATISTNSGISNTAIGTSAGLALTTGSTNTLVGFNAGANLTTGSSNIIIGSGVNAPTVGGSNQINIGNALYGTASATALAGNIGIGIATPATRLHIVGTTATNTLRIVNGTQAAGRVLTSDATGNASWENAAVTTATGVMGTGGNLGSTVSGFITMTGSTIILPPGRWIVFGAFLARSGTGTGTATQMTQGSAWISISLFDTAAAGTPTPDLEGSSLFISGRVANESLAMLTGNLFINNATGVNKTYFLGARIGSVAGTIAAVGSFGSSAAGENVIFGIAR